jgi:hypothetical protein
MHRHLTCLRLSLDFGFCLLYATSCCLSFFYLWWHCVAIRWGWNKLMGLWEIIYGRCKYLGYPLILCECEDLPSKPKARLGKKMKGGLSFVLRSCSKNVANKDITEYRFGESTAMSRNMEMHEMWDYLSWRTGWISTHCKMVGFISCYVWNSAWGYLG